MHPIHALCAVGLTAAVAFTQAPGAHWSSTTTTQDPPLRRENPGAADLSSMYVFGGTSGSSGGARMNDLWKFDGTTWTQMTADGAVGSPPARFQAGVTWDFARNRLVVFGGFDAAGAELGDTWEWDPGTNTWANVTPAGASPSARRFTAMAYDFAANTVLLFGGLDATGTHLNDTWSFDGSAWTQLSPAGPQPSVRRQHHLVSRPDFGDILLFGGQDATLPSPAKWRTDTWQWVGGAWVQIPTTNTPDAQVANDAAYDQIRKRVVLTGGNGTGGSPVGTTSEFDSATNDWISRPIDPGIFKTSRYFAAYIPTVGKTFKVSGQALNAATPPQNTYEYQTDFVASYGFSQAGCPGLLGVPSLAVDQAPWLGTTMTLSVSNVSPQELVLFILGFSDTTWNGRPLPLDMTSFGAAGCNLYTDPDTTFFGLGPAATYPLALPNNPIFLGTTFFNQAAVVDTVSGSIGATGKGIGVTGAL